MEQGSIKADLKEQGFSGKELSGKVAEIAATQWKDMDESAKAPYQKRHEEDTARYQREEAAFEEAKLLEDVDPSLLTSMEDDELLNNEDDLKRFEKDEKLPAPKKCEKPSVLDVTETSATLAFKRPQSLSGIRRFELRLRNSETNKPLPEITLDPAHCQRSKGLECTLEDLNPISKYGVKIRAIGSERAIQKGQWSDECFFDTQAEAPDSPESPVVETCTESSVSLQLKMPSSATPIIRMELLVKPLRDGDVVEEDQEHIPVPRPLWADLSSSEIFRHTLGLPEVALDPGTTYRIQLRAKGERVPGEGWGDWSTAVEATTSPPRAVPLTPACGAGPSCSLGQPATSPLKQPGPKRCAAPQGEWYIRHVCDVGDQEAGRVDRDHQLPATFEGCDRCC